MMGHKEIVIEAKGLGYQIGQQHLLHEIDWQIHKGERWLLYGLNGCGKTTLLSILAGFRQQTQGELRLFGEPFTNETVLQKRRRIGWISSSFFDSRYHHERVLDIVLSGKFGTYGLDLGLESIDLRRARALLNALGLEDKHNLSYDRLSKGQRQNVLIARAFMHKPDILLLDEPCSGLDALAKARFMELLTKLMVEEDLTVLFVSHEVGEVQDLFQKVLLLRNGRIFAQGNMEDVFTEQKLTAFYQQPVAVKDIMETQVCPAENHRTLNAVLFKGNLNTI